MHWVEALKPVYLVGKAGGKAYHVASAVFGRLNPWSHRNKERHLAADKAAASNNGSGAASNNGSGGELK